MKKNGGFPLPKEPKEVKQPMAPCSAGKYAQGDNPQAQDKSTKALADFAKKNKMKY